MLAATKKALAISIACTIIVTIMAAISNGGLGKDQVGLTFLALGIIIGLTGIFLSGFKKQLAFGQGMLIASGLILLVGFALCSSSF